MKIYSFIIISFTLLLFYNLAVHQQNERNLESVDAMYNDKTIVIGSSKNVNIDEVEEFSMYVTGKEHRYLNLGLSYIEEPLNERSSGCIADNSLNTKINLSGS